MKIRYWNITVPLLCLVNANDDVKSVSPQEELEKKLFRLSQNHPEVHTAGRTDAGGVHGTGQSRSLKPNCRPQNGGMDNGCNANMPKDDCSLGARRNEDFHARFSATARRYRHIIFNHALRPGILNSGVSHYHGHLDEKKDALSGCQYLRWKWFTSFRANALPVS